MLKSRKTLQLNLTTRAKLKLKPFVSLDGRVGTIKLVVLSIATPTGEEHSYTGCKQRVSTPQRYSCRPYANKEGEICALLEGTHLQFPALFLLAILTKHTREMNRFLGVYQDYNRMTSYQACVVRRTHIIDGSNNAGGESQMRSKVWY